MKPWLWVGLMATAIAVPALSGVARAGCSNATLNGEYAFGVTNFVGPQVVAGIKFFDGRGTLTSVITKATPLPPSSHRQGRKEEPTRSIPTARAAW
jgi:hypothetical protein